MPKPVAVTESPRMLLDTELSVTKHAIDTAAIQIVDTPGVRKRGWILAKCFGIAPCAAIARVARVVGKIVVCVEAEADVSTAMISSLSRCQGMTWLPSALRMSSAWALRKPTPWYACAAIDT